MGPKSAVKIQQAASTTGIVEPAASEQKVTLAPETGADAAELEAEPV